MAEGFLERRVLGSERRTLTPDQRAVLKELEEYSHKMGAVSNGLQWTAVPRNLLISAVDVIRQLRKVE